MRMIGERCEEEKNFDLPVEPTLRTYCIDYSSEEQRGENALYCSE